MATRAAVRRSRKDRAELLAKSPRLQRIVEKLETLFFKEGFLHIHTEELAHRLHCSKQTLYTLAQSRDELFEVILERFLSGIRNQARQGRRAGAEPRYRAYRMPGRDQTSGAQSERPVRRGPQRVFPAASAAVGSMRM
jgi:AcrR family transcriptional regulator